MASKVVTALPVFNEAHHVSPVLDEVLKYCDDVVVIDDGSSDDLFNQDEVEEATSMS